MIRRILARIGDWLTADARAEYDATQDDAPWMFRSRQPRHPNDAAMIDGARHSIPDWLDDPEEDNP